MYRIICYGPRLVSYGPFESVAEAHNYADKYLQDYRTEIIRADVPFVDTSHVLTAEELAAFEKEFNELTGQADAFKPEEK